MLVQRNATQLGTIMDYKVTKLFSKINVSPHFSHIINNKRTKMSE